ncbi:MAG: hypothetical protein ISS13_00540 [Actinobacteria bacterium]|nr:hypothetical protein [Actinomycetota bacterium]
MKKRFYHIISILVIVIFFSAAAICNFGQATAADAGDDTSGQEDASDSGKDKTSDEDSKGSSSTTDKDSSGKDDKSGSQDSGDKSSSDSKSTSNQKPVIKDINLSSSDLDIGLSYDVTGDASDPDNDPLTYKWSVDGGSIDDPNTRTIVWTTPMFPETYHITLEVSDGKGGEATMTKAVRVEDLASAIGQPPGDNPPVITDFVTMPGEPVYTDSDYKLQVFATDPDNDIVSYSFTVSGGTLSNQSSNIITWSTPSDADFYTVNVTVTDSQGNTAILSMDIGVEYEFEVIQ